MTVTNNELPKFTLKSLCEKYNKIEIPVLQREYAQGRDGEKSLRAAFVDYLVENLLNDSHVELDHQRFPLRAGHLRRHQSLPPTRRQHQNLPARRKRRNICE